MVKLWREHLPAAGIVALFLVIAGLFAWRTPDWQAPDEPAHYNYIAQVVSGNWLPVIQMGDWDNEYLETLKANDFAPELLGELERIRYENHQPPLYYWLGAPFFAVSDGTLLTVRLVSVLLGAANLLIVYAVALEIFPSRRELALAVLALIAFLPQQVHILSSVNNDALALPVLAGVLLLCLRYLRGKLHNPLWLGVGLALVIISKTTVYFMAAVVLLTLVMHWRARGESWRGLFAALLRVAIPAGIMAALYWGRNLSVYGFPDFLGLRQHDAIVIGQLRTAELLDQVGWGEYFRQAFSTTFQSFWGQFGWMEAPMGDAIPGIMTVIAVLLLLGLAGLLISAYRNRHNNKGLKPLVEDNIVAVLLLIAVLGFLQVIYYNLTFVQFQGRYLFTALIPLAVAATIGLDVWRRMLLRGEWAKWSPVVLFGLLALLDVYLIWRVIPGALS